MIGNFTNDRPIPDASFPHSICSYEVEDSEDSSIGVQRSLNVEQPVNHWWNSSP